MNRLMSKLGTQTAAPGGGGGGGAPLSNVFFVDAGNAQADPDGSIGNPFPTVQEALTAGVAAAATAPWVAVLVTPGDYSGETLDWAGGVPLQLSALAGTARVYSQQASVRIGPLVSSNFANLYLNGLQTDDVDGGFGSVTLEDCDANAATITCNGGIVGGFNCLFEACTLEGANVRLRACELRGAMTLHMAGGLASVTETAWQSSAAVTFDTDFPSFLELDERTHFDWLAMGVGAVLTNGSLRLLVVP